MEWQEFLDKSSLTARQKKLAKEIADGDNEDHKNLFAKKLEPKEASWESWLDKNNGIETDHKKENKKEWNGKFSSSTIRDDAENDDDKAVSEEESLEELTDGKLEEVEKLKSWQIFLKGFGGTEEDLIHEEDEYMGKKNMHGLRGRYQNPKKHKKGHFANRNTGKDAIVGTKRIPTPKKGAFKDTKGTKHMSSGDHKAVAQRVATSPQNAKFMTDINPTEMIGSGTDKRVPTDQEHDDLFHENTQPEINTTRRRMSPEALAARRSREKSWEVWLTKYVETDSDKELSIEIDTARQTGLKKIPKQRTKPESGVDAKEGEISRINAEKWKSWLEKMQGAGDARFGNQHLTGMEQHPVSDDDSLELSPETEENNEKQDKKEDKEEEDNKPYKALR